MSNVTTMRFDLPLIPMGKPRMTKRDKWKQRDCVLRYREWSDYLRLLVRPCPPADRVLRLDWIATFAMPTSWSGRQRQRLAGTTHRSTPDRDNIDKAILDALWQQDSAIAVGETVKRWGDRNRLQLRLVAYVDTPGDCCPLLPPWAR